MVENSNRVSILLLEVRSSVESEATKPCVSTSTVSLSDDHHNSTDPKASATSCTWAGQKGCTGPGIHTSFLTLGLLEYLAMRHIKPRHQSVQEGKYD